MCNKTDMVDMYYIQKTILQSLKTKGKEKTQNQNRRYMRAETM